MIKRNEFVTIKGNTIESATNIVKSKKITNCTIIMPHVCNNVGAFGAGFAKAIANEFPIVKENFHLLGPSESRLGKVQFVTALDNHTSKNKIIVANMIAQNGLINSKNRRPINYGALAYCMGDIRKFYNIILSKSEENTVEIHAPKFGSGLAGGNWNFVSDLINDIWDDIPVYVYNHHSFHKTESTQ